MRSAILICCDKNAILIKNRGFITNKDEYWVDYVQNFVVSGTNQIRAAEEGLKYTKKLIDDFCNIAKAYARLNLRTPSGRNGEAHVGLQNYS